MKIVAKSIKWNKIEAQTIVLLVSENNWQNEISELDEIFGKKISDHVKYDHFRPEEGKSFTIPTFEKIEIKTIVLFGVGKSEEISLSIIRKVGAYIAKYAQSTQKTSLAIDTSSELFQSFDPFDIAKMLTEGLLLGGYNFNKYKSNAKNEQCLKNVLFIADSSKIKQMMLGVFEGEIYSEATIYARDLVNEPAQLTTPTFLAQEAKNLAEKNLLVTILDKKEIAALGMGAFLSVAQGSDQPPKFIKLEYRGGQKKVVVVGKAITFDTGGHSLKDAKNMETMKLDMAGGAAILGLFSVLPRIKPNVTVIGLIAATENMLGPNATKPGDIVTAMNGKTIEVLNTDAEGRLTLADVLSYAVGEKPEAIVDLATLTGACVVALGEDIAGIFANNQNLTEKLVASGYREGEKIWPMPLEREYKALIKGDVADLRNIGRSRYGGAVTAALFLEQFVNDIPWAHLDIAGPAFIEKEMPLTPRGASGFGVRLLLEWLKQY